MVNSYTQCCNIEFQAVQELEPWLRQISKNGQFVAINKGGLAAKLQPIYGDYFYNSHNSELISLEIKAEKKFTGNFFLETWSNLSRYTTGWMFKLNCTLIGFYFLEEPQKSLRILDFASLLSWAFKNKRIYRYPEVPQKKYEQLNDTWGRLVPIDVLRREIGFKQWIVNKQSGLWELINIQTSEHGNYDGATNTSWMAKPGGTNRPPYGQGKRRSMTTASRTRTLEEEGKQ